jgi:hypothetical protein
MSREFAVNAVNGAGWNVVVQTPSGKSPVSPIYETIEQAEASRLMYVANRPGRDYQVEEILKEKKNGL